MIVVLIQEREALKQQTYPHKHLDIIKDSELHKFKRIWCHDLRIARAKNLYFTSWETTNLLLLSYANVITREGVFLTLI